ncbi:MAG: thioredoxin family protein [Marinomonas colpomeniae]
MKTPITAMTIGFNADYSQSEPSVDDIQTLSGVVLLEFGAPWCGHCQAAHSSIKEAMKDHAELAHIKIFDGKGKRLGRQFGVKLWPTLIVLVNGQEVERAIRITSVDEVRSLLVY